MANTASLSTWISRIALTSCSIIAAVSTAYAEETASRSLNRGADATPTPAQAPNSASATAKPSERLSLGQMLGDLHWGSPRDAVLAMWSGRIRERYLQRITATIDPMKQDRLRAAMIVELRQLKKGFVEFDGRTSGWDVSFLRDEFTQNNGESMLAVRDSGHQYFYFFSKDQLWKCYCALDFNSAAGRPFADFVAGLRTRQKGGDLQRGKLRKDGETRQWVEWKDSQTRMRAMDETQFYGFYGLVVEERAALARLDKSRSLPSDTVSHHHQLVELVVAEQPEASSGDQNADVADRITGQRRR